LGYLQDYYNYPLHKEYLQDPLEPGGNLRYKKSIYNFKVEQQTNEGFQVAAEDSILLFDGIFLLNDILRDYWDYKIYVDTSFEITLKRAIARDSELFGGTDEVVKLYRRRYIPGHEMYLSTFDPFNVSDIVLKNDDYVNPTINKLSNIHFNQILKENLAK
jgi:uridine kinase